MEKSSGAYQATGQKKPNKKRLTWALLAFVVLLLASVILLWQFGALGSIFRSKDVVGRVGNKAVTKQQVEKTISDAVNAGFSEEDKDQARELIMEYWLYTMVAKKYSIQVNDQIALDYLKSQVVGFEQPPNLDMNNSYVRYRAYRDYLRDEIANIINYPQRGAYIVAHFDQNFGQTTPQLKALSQAQYEAVLKSDRDYATNFINEVYSKIKAGQITFEQSMQLELNDKVIGEEALPTAIHSTSFGSRLSSKEDNFVEPITKNPQLKAQIEKLKAGEVSEPFILKVPPGYLPSKDMVDGIWMIAKVDEVQSKLPKFDSVAAGLEKFKKDYKYVLFKQ